MRMDHKIYEYAVVGGGVAGICALVGIIKMGVSLSNVIWIDPFFKVGDFGEHLTKGSGVPGNTAVERYQRVFNGIYEALPQLKPDQKFEIDKLHSTVACNLKIAMEPFQHISDKLRKLISSVVGKVDHVKTVEQGFKLIFSTDLPAVLARRVILATGAIPKPLPHIHFNLIDPYVAFMQSSVVEFLKSHPQTKKVAVVGSSHSAALAVMFFLLANVKVKQFMNKEYKFAKVVTTAEGKKQMQHDGTGLKGDVAVFTGKLLGMAELKHTEEKTFPDIRKNYERHIKNVTAQDVHDCDYMVPAIGFQPNSTLQVDGRPLAELVHDDQTTEFKGVKKGLFGVGIGFPQKVNDVSGETEVAVGIGKFWDLANNAAILAVWEKLPSLACACIAHGVFKQQIAENKKELGPSSTLQLPSKL